MGLFRVKMAIILLLSSATGASELWAQERLEEKHIEVSLRMIGDQVLLKAGDNHSRVLPIEKKADHYTIRFENEFVLNPDVLVKTVEEVMAETHIADGYFLEVRACASDSVVYSVEMANGSKPELAPCQTREYPKACYSLDFTFYGLLKPEEHTKPGEDSASNILLYVLAASGLVLLIIGLRWMKNRKPRPDDPNVILLGNYQFRVLSGELKYAGKRIELTSKEADLLRLLHDSLNVTVARETILNQVWGDEGDYVGRTLDVFISKLRKKLELDPAVKILNVRGVGYKLRIEE